jgi:hypothetical protein
MAGGVEAGDAVDDGGERGPLGPVGGLRVDELVDRLSTIPVSTAWAATAA